MEPKDLVGQIRQVGGMTQAQIAQLTGITQSTISKIERGEVQDVYSRSYRALQALWADVVLKSKAKA